MVAPGVYIEEDASLSLSVQSGATAVPVFVGNFIEKADFVGPKDSNRCIAISSWLDFTARFEGSTASEVKVTLGEDKTNDWQEEQAKVWAEKLAIEVTEAGGENSTKSKLKTKLEVFLGGLADKKWIVKKTVELKAGIGNESLLANWPKEVDEKCTEADATNFPKNTAQSWINTWINKTLQQVWQEFNTQNDANTEFTNEVNASTAQVVGAIPAEVIKRLEVNAATTVTSKLAFIVEKKVYMAPEAADSAAVNVNYGAFALQHYFSNGGTGCYILPLANNDTLATLPQEIQKHPDISLLVCAEEATDLKKKLNVEKVKVYTRLGELLGKNLGYFLLADEQDPNTEKAQTAVYYPNLVTTFQPSLPAVEDISLSVSGAARDKGTPIKITIAKLTAPASDTLRKAIMAKVGEAFKRTIELTSQITLPPSAAVAGAYARTDLERGVWKAPANVSLNAVERVEAIVTDATQGSLNEGGINVIRTFTGQGTVIWGARTLAFNSDDWRYIPVRRLFNAAERDIKRAMQVAVFETNNAPTWERVRSAIDSYLYSLWRQGALMGASEKEAYFVHIGKGITMTDDDIKQGKIIVKVGMAAVRPAEFIILQFTQNVA